MSNYKFIEHAADIAVEVSGGSYEEVFITALDAFCKAAMYTKDIQASEKKTINLYSEDINWLLIDFLNEINFLIQTKKWFTINCVELNIEEQDNRLKLSAVLLGTESTDSSLIKEEIKSVTYHQLNIRKEGNVYSTIVVFDI